VRKAISLTYEIPTPQEFQLSSELFKRKTTGKLIVHTHDLGGMAIFMYIYKGEFTTMMSNKKNPTYKKINYDFVDKRIFLPQSVNLSLTVSCTFKLSNFSTNDFTLILNGNFGMRG
jgi:hypothetical protein